MTYYYCYDANGNVGQMINTADGTLDAAYEYDPYGNLLKSEGDHAEDNPFRFSTKYKDVETGLVYYGYRYYVPELGRWISRDPIEEEGGINLYAVSLNNPVVFSDLKGLKTFFTIRSISGGVIFGGEAGMATARTECKENRFYEANYLVLGGGIIVGLDLPIGDFLKLLGNVVKNEISVLKGKEFSIDSDYPPKGISYVDAEGPSISIVYEATLVDIEVSPHKNGRRPDSDGNNPIFSHGLSGDIAGKLSKGFFIKLRRVGEPEEKCCNESN